MIRHIWSIVCRESRVDKRTNGISIANAYENIQVSFKADPNKYKKGELVGVPFDFELVSLFFREEKGTKEQISEFCVLLDPRGKKLAEFDADVVFEAAFDRMRNVFKFDSLALTTSGTYLFQVYIQRPKSNKRESVTIIPLDIKLTINEVLV